MDLSIVKKSGLTQKEFGDLVGVSRVTTNLWVNGKMNPHRYITDHVVDIVRCLKRAVSSGALPMTATKGRLQKLRVIVENHRT